MSEKHFTAHFFVHGTPKPAGSKRAFVVKGTSRAIVTDANPKARDWKIDVQHAARAAWGGAPLLDGAIKLILIFYFRRPKAHYRTGRYSVMLRDNAPLYKASSPDTTKLIRAVEDAITGIIWKDDAQIISQVAEKKYADSKEGVEVWIDGRLANGMII